MADEQNTLPSTDVYIGGLEGMTGADFKLPFIKLLQQLSPEINPMKGDYTEGARVGTYLNGATKEVYGKTMQVLLCRAESRMIEWKTKERDGGFAGSYLRGEVPKDAKRVGFRTYRTAEGVDGNELMPTMHYYVLILRKDGTFDQGVITMKGTQFKKAQGLNTQINSLRVAEGPNKGAMLAPFSFVYDFSVVGESSGQYSYYGYSVVRGRPATAEEKKAANAFKEIAEKAGLQYEAEGESEAAQNVQEAKSF